MKVKIINRSKHDLPKYETKASAGVDLRANIEEPFTLQSLERTIIKTGLYLEIPEKYEGQVKFCKLNTTKARRLAISQRVMGLPAILLYKAGEKIDECTKDDATKENIQLMVEKVL